MGAGEMQGWPAATSSATVGFLRGLVLGWTPLRLRLAVERSLLLHVRQRPLPWWGRVLGHSFNSHRSPSSSGRFTK